MNRNLLVGLIVVLLAVGGFMLVQSQSKTEAPTKTTVETQSPKDTPAAMQESESEDKEDAMEKATEHTVTLTNAGFEPKTITIKVGDEVVWENESGAAATVDSAQHPTHLVYPKLNLGNFNDGEELELVFDEAGKYNYHNHLNPSQFGTVVVE